MQISIPKVVRPLPLRDYAPEYGETALFVWCNPPARAMHACREQMLRGAELRDEINSLLTAKNVDISARMAEIAAELAAIGHEVVAWLAEVWSQGPAETRMRPDEIETLISEAAENDGRLYSWLLGQTLRLIDEYRSGIKKN